MGSCREDRICFLHCYCPSSGPWVVRSVKWEPTGFLLSFFSLSFLPSLIHSQPSLRDFSSEYKSSYVILLTKFSNSSPFAHSIKSTSFQMLFKVSCYTTTDFLSGVNAHHVSPPSPHQGCTPKVDNDLLQQNMM